MLKICQKDKDILKGLAEKYAKIAGKPIQAERRKLWTAHNGL